MSNLKRQDLREANSITDKPVVQIKEAWFEGGLNGKKFLCGTPLNHPKEYLNNSVVHTSSVQAVDGNIVETRNTVYKVLSWAVDEEYKKKQLELF